jgi:hypothetical protein
MNTSYKHPPLSPELERELSYFLRVRNRYTRIALGFCKLVFLWIFALGLVAIAAEVIGIFLRGNH